MTAPDSSGAVFSDKKEIIVYVGNTNRRNRAPTIMSLRGALQGRRGNLQYKLQWVCVPINIVNPKYTVLIYALVYPKTLLEIATSGLRPSSQ